MSMGDSPESLSQAMLVGCSVSREIGRKRAGSSCEERAHWRIRARAPPGVSTPKFALAPGETSFRSSFRSFVPSGVVVRFRAAAVENITLRPYG